jgi:hypothetical protein
MPARVALAVHATRTLAAGIYAAAIWGSHEASFHSGTGYRECSDVLGVIQKDTAQLALGAHLQGTSRPGTLLEAGWIEQVARRDAEHLLLHKALDAACADAPADNILRVLLRLARRDTVGTTATTPHRADESWYTETRRLLHGYGLQSLWARGPSGGMAAGAGAAGRRTRISVTKWRVAVRQAIRSHHVRRLRHLVAGQHRLGDGYAALHPCVPDIAPHLDRDDSRWGAGLREQLRLACSPLRTHGIGDPTLFQLPCARVARVPTTSAADSFHIVTCTATAPEDVSHFLWLCSCWSVYRLPFRARMAADMTADGSARWATLAHANRSAAVLWTLDILRYFSAADVDVIYEASTQFLSDVAHALYSDRRRARAAQVDDADEVDGGD